MNLAEAYQMSGGQTITEAYWFVMGWDACKEAIMANPQYTVDCLGEYHLTLYT